MPNPAKRMARKVHGALSKLNSGFEIGVINAARKQQSLRSRFTLATPFVCNRCPGKHTVWCELVESVRFLPELVQRILRSRACKVV